jgi:glyoxylase-like metal-dependent hydrolase (beta-lactamase superfamily II)
VSEGVLDFTVGSFACHVVPDGVATYEKETLYSDVRPDELEPALIALLNDQGLLQVPYHPLLVDTARGPVLIDAGAGPALAEEWGDPIGRLWQTLPTVGVDPGDVELVLISHAHVDHIGGLTVGDAERRSPVFPRARHVISRTEFEYWMSDRLPDDLAEMGELARLHLTPLERAGILDPIDGEQEVTTGIRMIPAPGHTPGHVAILVSSGSETAIFVADAVLGETQFEHPDWSSHLEVDRAEAIRTRRKLLDEAGRDSITVAGYHLWGPGTVRRQADVYRWDPFVRQ